MRRSGIPLSIISIIVLTSVCTASFGDEIEDLKGRINDMKARLEMQMGLIEAQQRQIQDLERKVDILETVPVVEGDKASSEKTFPPGDFDVSWKNGLKCTKEGGTCSVAIGGRFHADMAWFGEDEKIEDRIGNIKDSGQVRRVRFFMKGTVYEDFLYKVELDFAGGNSLLRDTYIGMKNIPYLGTVRIGHFFEPIGLEQLTSTNYSTFLEWGTPAALMSGRNTGMELHNAVLDDSVTWSTGVFRNADNFGTLTSNEWNWTSRITAVPWYEDEGRRLFHVGGAYSLRNPEETITYSSRPENNLAPVFVTTGAFAAETANVFSGETALVLGPLSLQGEYVGSLVKETVADDGTYFQSVYGQISYFLTGEHRSYNRKWGIFSRVIPEENFSVKKWAPGAWELAGRMSYIDLDSNGIRGGEMTDVTLGVNWYWTPNIRIMADYVHSYVNEAGGADIIMTRFQVDF